MLKKKILSTLLLIFLLVPQVSFAISNMHPTKAYEAGKAHYDAKRFEAAIPYFEVAIKKNPTAANYRILADTFDALGRYDEAIPNYLTAADIYEGIGLVDAAIVLRRKADSINSVVEVFVESKEDLSPSKNLAKYEPELGLYFGAFVEYEAKIGSNNVAQFNKLTGQDHAVYFTYAKYLNGLPYNWAEQVKQAGAAVHLAMQTDSGLGVVKEDEHLRNFARMCKAAEVPIFLRFNSEMNGDWVKWHGDPKKYIETFQLVSKIMKEEAPNVAMVWTPNAVPTKNILDYYPGDAYVDWVGVNLYSVKFFNGNINEPADGLNPLTLLDYVYETFSDRKPIQVSEYGATHYSIADQKDATDFAITKMHMLYYGAKLKYPKLKGINWFSVNTLERAYSEDRKLNNFAILENPKLLEAYKKMLDDPYFLSEVVGGPYAKEEVLTDRITTSEFTNGKYLTGLVKGNAWIKTYDPYISKVVYKVDGNTITTPTAFPFEFTIDTTKLSAGSHILEIAVYDSKGNLATKKNLAFQTGNRKEDAVYLVVGQNEAFVKGKNTKLLAPPFVSEGATYVPLRFISEAFGNTVEWQQATGDIVIKNESKTLTLKSSQGILRNGSTFVPVRFILEQFGLKVNWNGAISEIEITQ